MYRVEENGQKKLSSADALVQFAGASGVFIIEDGVGEETTGLSG